MCIRMLDIEDIWRKIIQKKIKCPKCARVSQKGHLGRSLTQFERKDPIDIQKCSEIQIICAIYNRLIRSFKWFHQTIRYSLFIAHYLIIFSQIFIERPVILGHFSSVYTMKFRQCISDIFPFESLFDLSRKGSCASRIFHDEFAKLQLKN